MKLNERDIRIVSEQALKAVNKFNARVDVFGRLELTEDRDKQLMEYYIVQRVLRTSIYDSSWRLSHPFTLISVKFPLLSGIVHSLDRRDRSKRQECELLIIG